MKLIIDTNNIVPVYKQIVGQIIRAIENAELKSGDHLPSIRQIAKDLNINPNTVAKSYQNLESDQIIISAGRKGSFVHQNAVKKIKELSEAQLNETLSNAIKKSKSLGFKSQEIKKKFNQIISGEKI